ncbi:FAD binding domain-containing protein [Nonomuraea sp. NPDC050556]|uniref:FAD binding domain-containing protein n=1 Tax=Nonomuraea sp. NPDC050556 TaxID=3364369 RepID=UPI0037B6C0FE
MKPPPFEYHAPRELGEALEVLAGTGAHGKVLAGGQSLIPLMNMRLAAPEHLIDINRLHALAYVDQGLDGVTIGALTRHSAALGGHPLLDQALRHVAHPVIRNRGTVVGSLVHADPAAELPAVLAVLEGSVRLARYESSGFTPRKPSDAITAGYRDVPAAEFFVGPLESALQSGELAVSAYFPNLPPRTGSAFRELARRHGDYALAGVCAVVTLDEDLRVERARTACIGVGPVPMVADVTEQCARRPVSTVDWRSVARAVQESTEPEADIHATAEYRRHLVGVLAEQALREAARAAA